MYLQLKTTLTHTASDMPGQKLDSSSNATPTSNVNMVTDTVSVPVDSDEEYCGVPVRRKKKVKHNPRGPTNDAKCQMDKLKTHHLLQLIGSLKWSNGVILDHQRKVKEYMKRELIQKGERSESIMVEYEMNRNNIGAHGLLILQHRIYLTRLLICEIDKELRSCPIHLFMDMWGQTPSEDIGMKVPSIENLCTRFTMAEEYLDVFEPVHLKALLIFLRVLIWGQSQISKNQPIPTVTILPKPN